MKSFILLFSYIALANAATLLLSKMVLTSTPHDVVDMALSISGKDEAIYLTKAQNNADLYDKALNVITLSFYNKSQSAGACVDDLKQKAIDVIRSIVAEIRSKINLGTNTVQNALLKARTPEEMKEALILFDKTRALIVETISKGEALTQDAYVAAITTITETCKASSSE